MTLLTLPSNINEHVLTVQVRLWEVLGGVFVCLLGKKFTSFPPKLICVTLVREVLHKGKSINIRAL